MTFPRTKIQPPRPRPGYIERGAVEARLSEALATRRVVLVCAPAGYGKTSFVAHGVAALPQGWALAWVSADAGDDLQRLLECLLAALEPMDPPWRTAPEALVHRVAGGAEEERLVAAELINTLEAIDTAHGVIVIDDLHRVEDPAPFRFLDRLSERLGARWTLLLSSRTDPAIALPRLRAAGDLAEFRQPHLQFARDEARRLVSDAGLDTALADRVFDRTQGWPAGLRMAVGALQGEGRDWSTSLEKALRGGERPMFDFLMAEVLDQLRPELADFLLRTSVLEELEPTRCAEVSGNPRAAALLDEIERLGLFVDALEAPERTLRLHDLFREALQRRLERADPEALAAARRRAAATEPDAARRIAMLVALGDLQAAASLAHAELPRMIVTTGTSGPAQAVARFPAPFRERSPELAFVRGLIGWVHWDFAGMLEHFTRAETGFTAAGETDKALWARGYLATTVMSHGRLAEAARLLASMRGQPLSRPVRIAMLNAECWLAIDEGHLDAVAGLLSEMLDLLEQEDRVELWYHTSTPLRIPGLRGIAGPLARHARLQLRAFGDAPTPLRPLGMLVQAWQALWRGDLPAARELRERARAEADWAGNTGAVHSHLLTLTAFTEAVAGDRAAAMEAAVRRLEEMNRGIDWLSYLLALFAARVASACNDAPALSQLLGEMRTRASRPGSTGRAGLRIREVPLAANLAWLEGRRAEAIAGWRAALPEEEAIDVYGQAAEVRVRLAAALVEARDIAGAAEVLEPFFARLAANGGPGGALFAMEALHRLAETSWRDALPRDRQEQLRQWSQIRDAATAPQPEPLTARELQVLERIAAGDSNKHIARALDLSLHTVKRHVANILGKLQLETRGQAAAWFRADRKRS